MECASLRNTATDRAPLLSMSDQGQDMNETPSLIVAGPAVIASCAVYYGPKQYMVIEQWRRFLRQRHGMAVLVRTQASPSLWQEAVNL